MATVMVLQYCPICDRAYSGSVTVVDNADVETFNAAATQARKEAIKVVDAHIAKHDMDIPSTERSDDPETT